MNKEILISHIKTKWYYYLIAILTAFTLSLLMITVASSPTKKEKVSIFLTCFKVDYSFNEYIESITPDNLEIIELNIKHKEDTYYGTVIKGYRKNADILIVPESKLDYIDTRNYLLITDSFMDELELTNKEYEYYFNENNERYGIKVYSKDTNKGILEGLIEFNKEGSVENHYLFINIKSMHLGKYNNSEDDGVIKILKEILNYEKKDGE